MGTEKKKKKLVTPRAQNHTAATQREKSKFKSQKVIIQEKSGIL